MAWHHSSQESGGARRRYSQKLYWTPQSTEGPFWHPPNQPPNQLKTHFGTPPFWTGPLWYLPHNGPVQNGPFWQTPHFGPVHYAIYPKWHPLQFHFGAFWIPQSDFILDLPILVPPPNQFQLLGIASVERSCVE